MKSVEYIYIYIYNVIYRQIVLLYHNYSMWLVTQDASSWDRKPPNFTLDMVSNYSAISATGVSSGIIRHMYQLSFCLHFALSVTRVLNSLEELCNTRVAVVNSFTRVLKPREGNVYIYIYNS